MRNMINEPRAEYNFSVIDFIERESEADIEWHKQHFPDGSHRHEFRDEKERVENCRKPYGVGINESGVLYIKRSYPCHILTGPYACQDCLDSRRRKRERDYSGRIDNVDESIGLYCTRTRDRVEQRRLAQNCKYHGYDYFAVPTGTGDEKLVIVNGPVKGSDPISRDNARRLILSHAHVLSEDRSAFVSGNLGKESAEEDDRDDADIVEVYVRVLIYSGDKRPSGVEVAIANAKVASRMQINGSDITADNIQEIVSKRESESMRILQSMGFRCKFSAAVRKKFNLAALRRQWLSIERSLYSISGSIESISDITRYIIEESVGEQNEKLRREDIDDAIDSVSSRLNYR